MIKYFLILMTSVTISFCAKADGVYNCFSYQDIKFSEEKQNKIRIRLSRAIKNDIAALGLFYSLQEMSYNPFNYHPKGSKAYIWKEQAIIWDFIWGNKLELLKAHYDDSFEINQVFPVDVMVTPLIAASSCGYAGIVDFLLDNGADPTIKGLKYLENGAQSSISALEQAKKNGHVLIVEKLTKSKQHHINKS